MFIVETLKATISVLGNFLGIGRVDRAKLPSYATIPSHGYYTKVVDRATGEDYAVLIGSYTDPEAGTLHWVLDRGDVGFTIEANGPIGMKYELYMVKVKVERHSANQPLS